MQIRIPKLNAEHFFELFLALYWGHNIIFSYVRAAFLRIPYIEYLADYIFPCLMIVCLFFAIPYFKKIILIKDFLFYGIVAVVFLFNFFLFPENESLITIWKVFFVSVLPMYFIGLRFDCSRHFRILYIMSLINIWAFAVYNLFINSNRLDITQIALDSFMERAYFFLPQLLVVICDFFKKKSILNIVTGIIGIVLLFMCGNRGTVVLLLIFILLQIFLNTNGKQRIFMSFGAITIFAIVIYFYQILIVFLSAFFSKMSMSIRIFERLADGTFLESNGRNIIIEKLTSAIKDNPVIGYGLCSDRTIAGNYAHNYAFELWTAFGVIFGSILLIATIYVILRAWIYTEDIANRGIVLMLICVGFFKLFMSSSFLLEGLFFMLIGYCIGSLRKHKIKNGALSE